jgi:DNA-binding MarR family transcriptional regulator
MKINVLNEKLNKDPEKIIEVTREQFFRYFFRMLLLKTEETLSDNEIKVLSTLCSKKDISESGISKSNLIPVVKKLNQKNLMKDKELSDTTRLYAEKLTDDVSIVFNFKIIEDDIG